MHDIVIKGGLVVDGTGAPAVVMDVAVKDGLVAALAPNIDQDACEVVDPRRRADARRPTPTEADNRSSSDRLFLELDEATRYSSRNAQKCAIYGLSARR